MKSKISTAAKTSKQDHNSNSKQSTIKRFPFVSIPEVPEEIKEMPIFCRNSMNSVFKENYNDSDRGTLSPRENH